MKLTEINKIAFEAKMALLKAVYTAAKNELESLPSEYYDFLKNNECEAFVVDFKNGYIYPTVECEDLSEDWWCEEDRGTFKGDCKIQSREFKGKIGNNREPIQIFKAMFIFGVVPMIKFYGEFKEYGAAMDYLPCKMEDKNTAVFECRILE